MSTTAKRRSSGDKRHDEDGGNRAPAHTHTADASADVSHKGELSSTAPEPDAASGQCDSHAPAAVAAAASKDVSSDVTDADAELEPQQSRWLDACTPFMPFIVFLVAAATRFYRLDQPPGVVFDEHHFGRFTNQYLAGTYFFDIHPPLGKLVFYCVARLVGYEHSVCHYANIDDQYLPECKYIWLRFTSALFGSLTAPLVYTATRRFGAGVRGGILAAALFIFDGLNIGESRLVLIDGQLLFWCAASLVTAQVWWSRWNTHAAGLEQVEAQVAVLARPQQPRTQTQSHSSERGQHAGSSDTGGKDKIRASTSSVGGLVSTPSAVIDPSFSEQTRAAVAGIHARWSSDPRRMTTIVRVAWALVIGVVTANAVSVKFTGLGTPGMIAVESFMALLIIRRAYPLPDLLLIAATAALVFSGYWWIHFALLPLSGDGDNFMLPEFRRTLIGNPDYDVTAEPPSFISSLLFLNQDMVKASDGITQRHHWDSYWYEWILNIRGILYYSVDKGHSFTQTVYLLGNPLVIWLCVGTLAVSVLLLAFFLRYRHEPGLALVPRYSRFFSSLIFCLAAYAVNMLPYLAVSRSCFIYHYMPALMYAEIMTGLVLDALLPPRAMRLAYKLVLLIVAAGFLFFSPWIYALPLTNDGHARRRWLPRWD